MKTTFDVLGRLSADTVITIGSSVGPSSDRRLSYTFNTQGLLEFSTSYSDSSGSSITNQVKDEYNGLGQLTAEYQSHSGEVNTIATPTTPATPAVRYSYSGLANGSRLTAVTYPNGKQVRYSYGTPGSLNDRISRLEGLNESSNTQPDSVFQVVETYSYLGLSTSVVRSRPAGNQQLSYVPATRTVSTLTYSGTTATATLTAHGYQTGDTVIIAGASPSQYNGSFVITVVDANTFTYTMANSPGVNATGAITATSRKTGDAGDQYVGLDRFGRIVDQSWSRLQSTGTGDNQIIDRFQYGYDANSNVLYEDNLGDSKGENSELYSYDSLNRLTGFDRGKLNPTNTGLTTTNHSQDFTMNALGGVTTLTTDSTSQNRAFNADNQIAGLSYDDAGNMTADNSGKHFVYDAWNRVIEVRASDNTTILEKFAYDALNRKTSTTVTKAITDPTHSGTTATATLTSHGYRTGDIVLVAGASPSQYNGSFVITAVDANTFTYSMGSDPGSDATGTFTASQTTDAYFSASWQDIEETEDTATTPRTTTQSIYSPFYVDDLIVRDRDVTTQVAGTPDSSFGNNGSVITDVGGIRDFANAVAVQSDGKYVVAGQAEFGTWNMCVVRYNPDGTLDQNFNGGEGKIIVDAGGEQQSVGTCLVLQPDGKILVGGYIVNSVTWAATDFCVIRLNSDGTLDTTFGSDGIATESMGSSGVSVAEMTLDSSGRITLVGQAPGQHDEDVAIVRFTASGSLDTTFNSTGTLVITDTGTDSVTGAALDADGKLVIVGTKRAPWDGIFLARVNPDGSIDSSFRVGEEPSTYVGGNSSFGEDVVILPDGKLMVAAEVFRYIGGEGRLWSALVRFDANGSLDASYGSSGYNGAGTPGGGATYTDDVNNPDCITSLTLQPDGKLVVTGFYYASPTKFIVARHNADGTYDPDFAAGDKLMLNFGATYGLDLQAATIVDGRIVAVGCKDTGTGYGEDFAVVVLEGGDRLEERLWATHDANWNITAVTDVMGNAAERYEYDPYGTRTVYTPTWDAVTGNVSSYNMVNGHQGLRIDTITGWWDGRNRWLIPSLQTWNRADPNPSGPYVDGMSGYGVERSNPVGSVDPHGTQAYTVQASKARPWRWEAQWQKVGPVVPGVPVASGVATGVAGAPISATCYHYRQYYCKRYAVLFLYSDATDTAFYRWGIGVITGYADASKAYEMALTIVRKDVIPIPIGFGQTTNLDINITIGWALPPVSWGAAPAQPSAGISPEPIGDIVARTFSNQYTLVTAVSSTNPVLFTPPPPF